MTKVNEEILRELYGEVSSVAAVKTINYLDENCLTFIDNSTFCIVATSDGFNLDVSPKGDPAGFIKVLDDKTLVIPDRPGNNRIDGLLNLLKHPKIGLLFLIPAVDETLRINGSAEIVIDSNFCKDFSLKGKAPKTVTKITVDEAFLHCGKALMRAGLWNPKTWLNNRPVPNLYEMVKGHVKGHRVPDLSQDQIELGYKKTLY